MILSQTSGVFQLIFLSNGDDNVRISKFQIFIVKIENFVFATRRRNIAQSIDLGEYILNMPKFFVNGWVVMEIQLSKVEEKWENSSNVHKILSVFGAKITKMCSKNHENFLKIPQLQDKISQWLVVARQKVIPFLISTLWELSIVHTFTVQFWILISDPRQWKMEKIENLTLGSLIFHGF